VSKPTYGLSRVSNWQEALTPHPFARRLRMHFDPVSLNGALAKQRDDWWSPHLGPYHNGGWESISIWAPNGNLREQRSGGGAYAKTVAALVSPYIWSVVEEFDCQKSRVRLMRLKPGGQILRHSDPLHDISPRMVRLHVPICTNPDVHFVVNRRRVEMLPGEVWHIDVRFPHEVQNHGDGDRVHLVLDLQRNSKLDALLGDAQAVGTGYLTSYYIKQFLPHAVKRAFNIGN